MPSRMIELHDSVVLGALTIGAQVIVFLEAYLHQSEGRAGIDPGTGWNQAAALVFRDGAIEGSLPELPAIVWEGDLFVDARQIPNKIPVPFQHEGAVLLQLSLDPGAAVTVRATGCELTLIGAPEYVEEFPGRS